MKKATRGIAFLASQAGRAGRYVQRFQFTASFSLEPAENFGCLGAAIWISPGLRFAPDAHQRLALEKVPNQQVTLSPWPELR